MPKLRVQSASHRGDGSVRPDPRATVHKNSSLYEAAIPTTSLYRRGKPLPPKHCAGSSWRWRSCSWIIVHTVASHARAAAIPYASPMRIAAPPSRVGRRTRGSPTCISPRCCDRRRNPRRLSILVLMLIHILVIRDEDVEGHDCHPPLGVFFAPFRCLTHARPQSTPVTLVRR